MRQALVVADLDANPTAVLLRRRREALLQIAVAGAEQGELAVAGDDVGQASEDEVEAFLRDQAADHAEYRHIAERAEPEAPPQRDLSRPLARRGVLGAIRSRQDRIVPGIPKAGIDAVQNPGQYAGSGPQ